MAGSASSRHQPPRRDRGPLGREQDRDSFNDGLMPYDDEPRGHDRRPALSRRSTYYDEYRNDEDRHYPPRSSDKRSRQHGRGRRRRSEPRSPSVARAAHDQRREGRDHSEDTKKRRNQMIKAGLTAGAVEAFRQRNRPGDWVGAKGVRVATAAISAALIDAGIDKSPNHGSVGNILKSTVGGLVFDKIANGGKR